MRLFSILGILLIVAISAFMLKDMGHRAVPIFVVFGMSIALGFLPEYIEALMPFLSSLFTSSATNGIDAIMKISGIGILAETVSEVLDTLGERALVKVASVVMRLEILLVVVPYFDTALKGVEGFL